MYFVRAQRGIKTSTTEALRKFYEKDSYVLLKKPETFNNLNTLAHFWEDVSNQDKDRFSNRVLKKLFVLNYAPNGMWTYFVSVYFMQNKDENDFLNEEKFYLFLKKIIGFIWTYAITNPGVNALRTPVYSEMINIINNNPVTFEGFKFDQNKVRSMFINFNFTNGRPITKAMLAWWAFEDEQQSLLSLETVFEIEHIYAKNRQEKEKSLINISNLESLGNKSLLEKRINIRASDYRFVDKTKYYLGSFNNSNKTKEGTNIHELTSFAKEIKDFNEIDIEKRLNSIMNSFIDYLEDNELIQ